MAEPVKRRATQLFMSTDARSASKYGVSVRRTGIVAVEQRLRRVTGKRGDYGALQMRRALIPAGEMEVDTAAEMMAEAVERIAEKLGGTGSVTG